MKISKLIVCFALSAPVSFAWAQKVDPNKLPRVDCDTLRYSSAFLDKYPKAPAACLEGRVYEGTTYGRFNAKVYIQNLPDYMTMQLLNVAGTMITTFSIKPEGGGSFYTPNGKETPAADLKVGQLITLWIPENSMEAKVLPLATAESWRVIQPAPGGGDRTVAELTR
jgi:hypothetical protein